MIGAPMIVVRKASAPIDARPAGLTAVPFAPGKMEQKTPATNPRSGPACRFVLLLSYLVSQEPATLLRGPLKLRIRVYVLLHLHIIEQAGG
jgi:hypothetical protein